MNTPTAADVRQWSPPTLDWSQLGYVAPTPPDEDPLAEQVAQAMADVAEWTGVAWSGVPTAREPLFRRLAWGMSLWTVAQGQEDYVETLLDFDLIQSFSAGGYSETRRSADDALKLVPWPWLLSLIRRVATDDALEKIDDLLGEYGPAYEETQVDWQAEGYGVPGV